MAKTSSKSAGAQAIKAGPSGKMAKFKGVGTQAPDKTAVSAGSSSGKFAKGGPSGKMAKFTPVKPLKPA